MMVCPLWKIDNGIGWHYAATFLCGFSSGCKLASIKAVRGHDVCEVCRVDSANSWRTARKTSTSVSRDRNPGVQKRKDKQVHTPARTLFKKKRELNGENKWKRQVELGQCLSFKLNPFLSHWAEEQYEIQRKLPRKKKTHNWWKAELHEEPSRDFISQKTKKMLHHQNENKPSVKLSKDMQEHCLQLQGRTESRCESTNLQELSEDCY